MRSTGLKTFFVVFFSVVAIVAFCVAIVYTAPIIIGSVAVTIPCFGSLTSAVALGISSLAGAAAVLIGKTLVDENDQGGVGIEPPTLEKIVVTIKKDGKRIERGNVFYVAPNSSIDFEIDFTFPSSGGVVSYGLYEPYYNLWYPNTANHSFFSIKAVSGNTSEMDLPFYSTVPLPSSFILRISRNDLDGTGGGGGYLDFVLLAEKSMVVNDTDNYFDIYDPNPDSPYYGTIVNTNSVYVIRLTIRAENKIP